MVQATSTLTCLEARIDWISASSRAGDCAGQLRELANTCVRAEELAGDRRAEWGLHGWMGERCGGWRWGTCDAGTIVQVSGPEAELWAVTLAQLATKWSRVDFAVTVRDETCRVDPATENYHHAAVGTASSGRTARRGLVLQTDGARTLYCGSRRSALFGRIYDKFVESGGLFPAGTWRWEVECKRHAAEQARERALCGMVGNTYVLDTACSAFRLWNIDVPWGADASVAWPNPVRPERDAERSLRWLAIYVAPTIQWLEGVIGAKRVRSALGMIV